ncbi:hypothetical protein ACOMHN_043134 [Nucella lapillus]
MNVTSHDVCLLHPRFTERHFNQNDQLDTQKGPAHVYDDVIDDADDVINYDVTGDVNNHVSISRLWRSHRHR